MASKFFARFLQTKTFFKDGICTNITISIPQFGAIGYPFGDLQSFFFKKSMSHIIPCSFDIFYSIFLNQDFFLKVRFALKLRCQFYNLNDIGYPFGDQSLKKFRLWPIGKKVCMAPIITNDSILDAPKYSQQNPFKS